MSDERILILEMLKDGKITVEEAERLLQKLDSTPDESESSEKSESDSGKKPPKDPWQDMSDVLEKLGSEMEHFGRDFGKVIEDNFGPRWSKKMEHVAENFGTTMKKLSQDFGSVASEAAKQFFTTMGIDVDININRDGGAIEASDTWNWEEVLDSLTTLEIQNLKGDISISGSDDDTVRVSVEKVARAESVEAAEEKLTKIEIVPSFENGILKLISRLEQGYSRKSFTLNYSIVVPHHTALNIELIKGDIGVNSLQGDQKLSIQKGDITVSQSSGLMHYQVSKGDVATSNTTGDCAMQIAKGDCSMKVHTGNASLNVMKGDCFLTQLSGDIRCQVAMGDISVREHQGKAAMVTAKGDIQYVADDTDEIELTANHGDQAVLFSPKEEGNYSFIAHHGDVSLKLVGEPQGNYTIHVINGDIESNFLDLPEITPTSSFTRSIGESTASIKVNLTHGDLEILSEEEREN